MAKFKKRPRPHIIADLSVNYLERFFLYEGHMVDRPSSGNDYGFDLSILTFNSKREIENGWIYIQLKATDNIRSTNYGKTVSVSIRRVDIHHWLGQVDPVILVIYDSIKEEAFWIHIQNYFNQTEMPRFRKTAANSLTVLIPFANKISREAVQHIVNGKRCQYAELAKLRNKIIK